MNGAGDRLWEGAVFSLTFLKRSWPKPFPAACPRHILNTGSSYTSNGIARLLQSWAQFLKESLQKFRGPQKKKSMYVCGRIHREIYKKNPKRNHYRNSSDSLSDILDKILGEIFGIIPREILQGITVRISQGIPNESKK